MRKFFSQLRYILAEQTIKRLDIKEGDIVFFDPQCIETSHLQELLVDRYAATPGAPKAWFFAVKLRGNQTMDDVLQVVSGATFRILDKVD